MSYEAILHVQRVHFFDNARTAVSFTGGYVAGVKGSVPVISQAGPEVTIRDCTIGPLEWGRPIMVIRRAGRLKRLLVKILGLGVLLQ